MDIVEKAGVVALGIFVGMLVSLGLVNTKPTVRTVLSILAAVLGGVPVAFLGSIDSKWMYPLGLLVGFLWTRALGGRKSAPTRASSSNKSARHVLSADLISGIIVVATIVLLVVVTPGARVTQSGFLELQSVTGSNLRQVYYPEPFASIPYLQINGAATFQITEQRVDGFTISLQSYTVGGQLRWDATGRRKK